MFLFKADVFGALSSENECREVFNLIKEFVTVMSRAASSEHHVGWRYSQLLMALWSNGQSTKDISNSVQSRTSDFQNESGRSIATESQARSTRAMSSQRDCSDPNSNDSFPKPSIGPDKASQPQTSTGVENTPFLGPFNSSAPLQLNDFNFPTPDLSWINMSIDASQNFFTMDSPFGLNEMWAVPQLDDEMHML